MTIKRLDNGLYYVKPADRSEYSEKGSYTQSQAREHLRKLDAGLVLFKPLSGREHKPAFTQGYGANASTRSRHK